MSVRWFATVLGTVLARRSLVVGITLLILSTADTFAAEPLALHPQNPHYFQWRDKPTVLVTSAEHYGAVLNREFDFARYLTELQSHGLNHTRVFSGTYREVPSSFGITENTLAPKPGQYVAPWARSDVPGESDGGSKFDLSRWNEDYFTHLKDFMTRAAEAGVVVELTLFCPMYGEELWLACPMNQLNNINGVGDVGRNEAFTLKSPALLDVQLAFVRKVVQELRDYDNLYFEVCNEPYFGGVTKDWQYRVVETIVEAEKGLPQPHLISLNIANGRERVAEPHPAVSIFNFHYCTPADTVALNWGLNKVIGENETGFRGREDVLYRTEAWDFLLAGGALYNNLDYSFTASHPAGTLDDYQSPGGGSRALRQQLGFLKRFFDELDFIAMQPDQAVLRKVTPNLTASALVQRGQTYVVYLHVPLPTKPKQLSDHLRNDQAAELTLDVAAGQYLTTLHNPVTGETLQQQVIDHAGGDLSLNTPKFDNDVLVKLTRQP